MPADPWRCRHCGWRYVSPVHLDYSPEHPCPKKAGRMVGLDREKENTPS